MFQRLMPREGRFFTYFNEHAEQVVLGAEELQALMRSVDELDERKRNIENIEHRADKVTMATMQLLHQTWRSRIDRLNAAGVVAGSSGKYGLQQRFSASTRSPMSSVRQKR